MTDNLTPISSKLITETLIEGICFKCQVYDRWEELADKGVLNSDLMTELDRCFVNWCANCLVRATIKASSMLEHLEAACLEESGQLGMRH